MKIKKTLKQFLTLVLPYGFVKYKHNQNPFRKADGDNTLRLKYALNENSVVFDLGGYLGNWSDKIFTLYDCNIYCFEPVEVYSNYIKKRFRNNKKIRIFSFGLSSVDEILEISFDGASSSIFKLNSNKTEQCELKEATTFIEKLGITEIDLMKINIEGGEYDLLEHLIKTGEIKKIKNIQVQFHDFVKDAEKRMISIQNELTKTHKLQWQYRFVWENWSRK